MKVVSEFRLFLAVRFVRFAGSPRTFLAVRVVRFAVHPHAGEPVFMGLSQSLKMAVGWAGRGRISRRPYEGSPARRPSQSARSSARSQTLRQAPGFAFALATIAAATTGAVILANAVAEGYER